MAVKVLGKLMSMTFDGSPVCIRNSNYTEDVNIIDVTDTCTTGDGTETLHGRYNKALVVEEVLQNGGGVKQVGEVADLEFNSVTYQLTNVAYDVSYGEVDFTDTGTAAGESEFGPGFANRTITMDAWIIDTNAEPIGSETTTLTFASGITIAGTLRIDNLTYVGEVLGGVKYTITATWQGAVVETGVLTMAMADPKAVVLIYKDGTTDKAVTGTGTVYNRAITTTANSELSATTTIKFNGAVTKTVYTTI